MAGFNWDDYEEVSTTSPSKEESATQAQPTSEVDWDEFEEIGKESSSDSLEKPSEFHPLQSAGLGALQGLSFDFADEIEAGARAGLGGISEGDIRGIPDRYKDIVKQVRERYSKAREENPALYIAGDVGTGIATGLLTGGAGAVANIGKVGAKAALPRLLATGAAQGAIAGLGSSEGESLGDIASDTAIGAGTGAVVGAALPSAIKGTVSGAKKLGSTIADKFPETISRGIDAYGLAKKGIQTVGKEASDILDKENRKLAEDLIKAVQDQYKKGSKMVGRALGSSNEGPINVTKELKSIEKTIKDGNAQPEDIQRLLGIMDTVKEDFVLQSAGVKGQDKALLKLEQVTNKLKSKAESLGYDIEIGNPEIKEGFIQQTIDQTKKVTPKVHQVNIPKGEVSSNIARAEEALEKKLNRAKAKSNILGVDNDISESVVDNRVLQSLETFPDRNVRQVLQIDIPEDEIIQETVRKYKDLPLQEIQNLKMRMSDLAYSDKLDALGASQAKSQVKALDELIQSKMSGGMKEAYSRGNELMADTYEMGKLFKELAPNSGDSPKAAIDLANKIGSYSKRTGNYIDELPNYLDKDSLDIVNSAKEIATRNDLRNALKGEGGFLGGIVNPKGMAIRGGELLGNVSRRLEGSNVAKVVKTPVEVANKLTKASDDQIMNMATVLSNSDNAAIKNYGRMLQNTLKDASKRDRLLWALSQQPAFREATKDLIQDEENQ